jgi:hypothetical protein
VKSAGWHASSVGRQVGRQASGRVAHIVIAAVRVVEFRLLQRPGQSWPSRCDEHRVS